MKVSFRTTKSLVTGCTNGQMVDNTAAGGKMAHSMALESTRNQREKRSTAFGNRVIDVPGSKKRLLHR